MGLVCFFVFAHCNSPASPDIEEITEQEKNLPIIEYFTATPANLNYLQKSTLNGGSYEYHVSGGVKNIGTRPALNTKVRVDLDGCYGDPLDSGEYIIADDGRLEPQQQAGWLIKFDDTYSVLKRQMDSSSEIIYEITWEELR